MKSSNVVALKWYSIELFERGETALVWHPVRFILVDRDGKPIENCPSLRLVPGDELHVVEGVQELYGDKKPPLPNSENGPNGIRYVVMFRMVRGSVFSGALKHKDESKNLGEYMHVQQGWTI